MKTDSKQESISIILATRLYIYRLLQNFFGNEPAMEGINILLSDHTRTSLSLLSLEECLKDFENFSLQLTSDENAAMDKARSEYTKLFIGPAKLPAPPWESVYVTKERLLFQESTLKVRQWYLKYNFLPANYRAEPDDHIALELDFLANLSQLAEDALLDNKEREYKKLLTDQKTFLEDHLLSWVPQFASDLKGATSHPLYQGMSSLLNDFLKIDIAVLQELLELSNS